MAQAYHTYSSPSTPILPNGYFTLRSAHDGRILLVSEIGENPADRFEVRCFNSQEKGKRLFEHKDHQSSWQSRDSNHQTQKKYGGAIKTSDFILSFSGLPELADETLALLVAVELGWMDTFEAAAILNFSENEIGRDMILPKEP